MSSISVIKRNGTKQDLDIERFHKVVIAACHGLSGVSVSEVELKSHISFYNNIKSSEIQETLINAAGSLITEDTPNYQYVAGRLINYHLRKEVYGKFEPDNLYDHYTRIRDLGYYDEELGSFYSEKEWNTLEKYIKHDRDELFTYAAMEQWRSKYLVKNNVTNEYYETPQIALMLISMTLFARESADIRLTYVKDFYDAISQFTISLPTPVMAGVRTQQKQFSSCVLIETGDDLDSINATTSAIVKYVSKRAGIGISAGAIRASGDPIRHGDAVHTGVVPFYRLFESAIDSCSQGGIRRGSGTLHTCIWHPEIEDILVLKNNKGTEDNRVRGLDYSIQFNKLFYERLLEGKNITLISPAAVPGLYDAFFADSEKFKELYEKAEKSTKIKKKSIPAIELFSAFMQERMETGRIYFMNVDHSNEHSSFKIPIRSSNLCVSGETKVDATIDGVLFSEIDIFSVIVAHSSGKKCTIKSYNVDTGQQEFKELLDGAMTSKQSKVIKIKYGKNELTLTPEHKVLTKNRGYVMAKELIQSDELIT